MLSRVQRQSLKDAGAHPTQKRSFDHTLTNPKSGRSFNTTHLLTRSGGRPGEAAEPFDRQNAVQAVGPASFCRGHTRSHHSGKRPV